MENNTTMRRLGDFIRQVDVRNKDLAVTNLVGVNLDKEFMPSVANTVGTDMSTYKIVKYNQFGCKLMSVERDRKMPISLMKSIEPTLISSAYYVFEVIDENVLDPDYLFLQIKNPEFDRRLWFSSGGDVRGGVGFENLEDMPISVPPIDEQRAIVARHKAIDHKIDVNRRLIAALEETARTIYRHNFVDNIDPENLPEGWRMGTIGELFELQRGFDLPSQNRRHGLFPIYASNGIVEYHDEYKVKGPGIVTGRSGTIGEVFFVEGDFWPLNTALWIKDFKISNPIFAFYKLKELDLGKTVLGYATVPSLNRNDVHAMECIIPSKEVMSNFEKDMTPVLSLIQRLEKETIMLNSIGV
ncbi:MAG: restriction endonuclease subunit S [Clostridium sp.]|nr:restriction endonuclease subunit S [Clostridium sp.]